MKYKLAMTGTGLTFAALLLAFQNFTGPMINECQAYNQISLMQCWESLKAHKVSRIAITQTITCSGDKACNLRLQDFVGPAVIYGKPTIATSPPGIFRRDHFDYAIFDIWHSSKIEIRGLTITEGATNKPRGLFKTPKYSFNQSCDAYKYDGNPGDFNACVPTINIGTQSNQIMLDRITIKESKGTPSAIALGNVEKITIRNSTISHSWANGIWSTSGTLPVENEHIPFELKIENNRFLDNRCSGIEISAAHGSTVTGNYFSHNHMGSIYGHSGGQMAIEGADGLIISDNEIANGRIDEDSVLIATNFQSVGLEFSDNHLQNITVRNNYFHDLTGVGIAHDSWDTSCGTPLGVVCVVGPNLITNNIFRNTASPAVWGFDSPAFKTTVVNSCIGSSCIFKKSSGTFTQEKSSCILSANTGICSLDIAWSSKPQGTLSVVKVLIDGFTFAQATSGVKTAPWISSAGRFDLYDGPLLLDSLFVGTNATPPVGP